MRARQSICISPVSKKTPFKRYVLVIAPEIRYVQKW